jgi:hypothetical protein
MMTLASMDVRIPRSDIKYNRPCVPDPRYRITVTLDPRSQASVGFSVNWSYACFQACLDHVRSAQNVSGELYVAIRSPNELRKYFYVPELDACTKIITEFRFILFSTLSVSLLPMQPALPLTLTTHWNPEGLCPSYNFTLCSQSMPHSS